MIEADPSRKKSGIQVVRAVRPVAASWPFCALFAVGEDWWLRSSRALV
jgi:hypothetical protein